MIERAALYPKYVHFLLKLRSKVFTTVATLSAKAALSREPIPYARLEDKKFEPISPGTVWGSGFDCAWFEFEGEVPESAKGKKVVALIDGDGEGLVYIDGAPVVGITHKQDSLDWIAPAPGKQQVDLFDCAAGGEKVRILVDCGFNGNRGADP